MCFQAMPIRPSISRPTLNDLSLTMLVAGIAKKSRAIDDNLGHLRALNFQYINTLSLISSTPMLK